MSAMFSGEGKEMMHRDVYVQAGGHERGVRSMSMISLCNRLLVLVF